MKKRLTTEELAGCHDGLCGVSIGDGDCSCLVHWVTALQKELDEKELKISERNVDKMKLEGDLQRLQDDYKEMVKDRDGWQETVSRDIRWQDQLINERDAALRLNDEYRKALEAIANDKEGPFYPDGDAMSENTCAKIALGIACPLCGSPAPCTYHKDQEQVKRNEVLIYPMEKCKRCGREHNLAGVPCPCRFA